MRLTQLVPPVLVLAAACNPTAPREQGFAGGNATGDEKGKFSSLRWR